MLRKPVICAVVPLVFLTSCTSPQRPVAAASPARPAPGLPAAPKAHEAAAAPAAPAVPVAPARPALASELTRAGDEIVVCGRYFHTGAPVVLWSDPGGYDAYRVERRFAPLAESSWEASAGALKTPNRYGQRTAGLSDEEIEHTRSGNWDLPTLQRHVDQFVIHYDAAGTSRSCFRALHDVRDLSVHFMLDIDGTIYQTLDVKERAWHATIANDRSVGIEIANIGAFGVGEKDAFARWYGRDPSGREIIAIPPDLDGGGVRTAGFVGRPARDEMVVGEVQGQQYRQWDLTPEQYDSLIRLTATLCTVLPEIRCDYPRDEQGRVITRTLTPDEFEHFHGVLGHFHIQQNKIDPGPAFQWERVIDGARSLLKTSSAD
jgi:N-acetyl-anhydromuramyl-L-alanine amidase AmpD